MSTARNGQLSIQCPVTRRPARHCATRVAFPIVTKTPTELDITHPNVARVYDYWLGGKDNFAVDRELAESMLAIFPGLRELVRANRQFIARAVSWVAGQGIDQFIDAGAGLPTTPSTHESAQAVNPRAKVAYVDNDPVVINHAKALLADRDGRVSVHDADLRDPAAVLDGCTNLDTSEPLCLILAAVLHLMDAESARKVAETYVSRLPRGSYVIITLARYDDPVIGDQIVNTYSAASFFNHSREDAATFFAGLELLEPGLSSGKTWRGGVPDSGVPDGAVYPLVGVARKSLPADVRRREAGLSARPSRAMSKQNKLRRVSNDCAANEPSSFRCRTGGLPAERGPGCRRHSEPEHMRLRMALHAGEVSYDDHGVTAACINLAFRLLDASALKAALAGSPGVLALAASTWFFDEVIRHSAAARPATYRPVRVAVKETSTVAWIALPDFPYPADQKILQNTSVLSDSGVPHQLPAYTPHFVGRADELAALASLLDKAANPSQPAAGTLIISAIGGTAGIGKTALALRWAHQKPDRRTAVPLAARQRPRCGAGTSAATRHRDLPGPSNQPQPAHQPCRPRRRSATRPGLAHHGLVTVR
jgi:hypothetical protein